MRLTSLTLSNFRGFAREQTIDLDGDVVVLWGPNGTGKTTVLDALQWLIVGDLPRLRRSALKRDEDVVTSRYATGLPHVSVRLTDHEGHVLELSRHGLGKTMRFTMTMNGGASTLVDDDAELALGRLLGDNTGEARARFGRIHLLQQDELTELLHADTKERYRFLANLTGLEDLQRLDEQLRSELKALRSALRERQDDTERLQGGVAALEREHLDSARGNATQTQAAQARLRAAVARVCADLAQPPASSPEQLIDQAMVTTRSIRARAALLESLPGGTSEQMEELEDEVAVSRQAIASSTERVAVAELAVASRANQLVTLEREHDRAQRLAELALEELAADACPVCGQTYDREATRLRLHRILGGDERLREAREALDEERTVLSLAREEQMSAQAHAAQLERRVVATKQAAEARERARAELRNLLPGQVEGDPARRAHDVASSLEAATEILRSAIRDRDLQVNLQDRYVAASRDAEARRERLDSLLAEVAELNRRVRSAVEVSRWLGAEVVDTTSRILDASTPLVNALYARLDVHPTFRRFAFRPDRRYEAGHLRPWVYDDDEEADGNAVHVLSAAQLNALALCLFFALNLEEGNEFATAMLDDPVQSMDDVNVLSLVDVLRTLRSRRQLILTTHDLDLARLLTRKLRPLEIGQRTLFVTLAGWSTRGPRVVVEAREPDAQRARLELVGG
ncbi:MAG: hypothetical protein QOH12_2955 [Solirubrobacteraceae bacterium]|jgi:DNA repair exonuclease SbcCD ATPase subunit|nr:hypothetical protein [Solirubrobacteraceae bacterium]